MEAIVHKKGDSFNKVIRVRTKTWNEDTEVYDYAAVDITDATIFFMIKENQDDDDDDALLNKVITSHTTPLSGLSATACAAAIMDFAVCSEGESYYGEFQILDAAGDVMSSETFAWKQVQDIVQRIV